MKKILLCVLAMIASYMAEAQDVSVQFNDASAKVKQKAKDSVTVAVDGAHVSIESRYRTHKLSVSLSGRSDDGQLILKKVGKAKVKLDGLTLTCREGAPLWLKNKKKVEIKAEKGKVHTLTVTACADTANHKGAVIWAKEKLEFSGGGTLNVIATGDGCRGIKAKKAITIGELTLSVTTSGNNLGEKPFGFGDFPDFGPGDMPNLNLFPDFGNDSTRRSDFPDPPPGVLADSLHRIGPPDFGGNVPPFGGDSTMQGGFGGKHKYYAATKGIAAKGKITINSGSVTVRTSTAGAEGIEGKEGVVFNGGRVDVLATDDAINANDAIEFNGGDVIARSIGNDAVDANPQGGFFPPTEQVITPAIIIRGGTVHAWSQAGSPEEGLDSDFAPLAIEGGTFFTVGGSIGDAPSVPTNDTANQPTVLLTNLTITKDEPVSILDANDHILHTLTIPFSFRGSATLVTTPAFKIGDTYTIKTSGYEKTFKLSGNFTKVR